MSIHSPDSLPHPSVSPTSRLAAVLATHSIPMLRISLGLVIFGFGFLKFFPGASPAESLVVTTTELLTFGVVTDFLAMVGTAILECGIGITLLTGRGLRVGLFAMTGWLLGIMSPLVLMPADLFPSGLPTIEAQYVVKDIILAAAAAVVAAKELGARFVVTGS